MRRFRVSELVVGFLLGFATLLIIFLLNSDVAAHYEVCETTKEGAKECARYGVIGFAFREIGAALNDYNGLITAAATVFIAWFTWSLRQSTDKLWDAGERQLKLLADTSAAQSRDMQASIAVAKQSADAAMISAQTSKGAIRGVIAIKNFNGMWQNTNGTVEGYGISPNIENVGNSHATCQIFASSQLIDVNFDDFIFVAPDIIPQTGIVSPGTRITTAFPLGMTVADAVRVWSGEVRFLYYCRVNYRDIFNEPHHVECCLSIGFRGDPRTPPPDNNEFITYSPYGPQNIAS
jgi:hypothetical protein